MSTTSVQRESLNSKARDRRPKSAVGAGRQRNRAVRVPGIWPVARHHTRSGRVDRNRVRTGQPRAPPDAQAAAALARQDWIAWLSLMLSALLPLVIAPEPGNPVSVASGLSWEGVRGGRRPRRAAAKVSVHAPGCVQDMAVDAMIDIVPHGIVNWDDSVECAKTDVIDRASPVRQWFRRVQ